MTRQFPLRLVVVTLIMLAPAYALGQDRSLSVARFFDKGALEGEVRRVYLSGDNLDGRDISLFRSVMTTDSEADVAAMAKAAEADSRAANDIKRIVKGDDILALYFRLPPKDRSDESRFILFRRTAADAAMLIYIEGATSLDELVKVNGK